MIIRTEIKAVNRTTLGRRFKVLYDKGTDKRLFIKSITK